VFCIAAALLIASPSISAAKNPAGEAAKLSEVDRAEAAIKDLHSKLKITEAQEGLWSKVSQVMRENAKTMDTLMKARVEKLKTMNAVEDLKSYSEVTDAQAAGLKKFISVFEALYASLAEEQKKSADNLFKAPGQPKAKKK
jgi:hypothetical protein